MKTTFIVPTFEECDGFFVLQGDFFSREILTFKLENFDRILKKSFERFSCPEIKIKRLSHMWSFVVKFWGFYYDHFGLLTRKWRNRFKLVAFSLFAIIDSLLGGKFITLYFIWCVGDDFHLKSRINRTISPPPP